MLGTIFKIITKAVVLWLNILGIIAPSKDAYYLAQIAVQQQYNVQIASLKYAADLSRV